MGASSRQNTPDPGAESRYGPTPAVPGGGNGRPSPATGTGREVCRWPPDNPTGRSRIQPPTAPYKRANPGGQPDASDPLTQLPELLKVKEVAAILRVGRNQLYEAVARGDIRAVRIGRAIRIPKTALVDLLSAPPARPVAAASPEVSTW
jgi:excisionase family DNA binding protein